MDPDATLAQLRSLIAEERAAEFEYDMDRYESIMELFEALDQWMSNGGHKPGPWAGRS